MPETWLRPRKGIPVYILTHTNRSEQESCRQTAQKRRTCMQPACVARSPQRGVGLEPRTRQRGPVGCLSARTWTSPVHNDEHSQGNRKHTSDQQQSSPCTVVVVALVSARERVCARVCVCACVCARVCVCVWCRWRHSRRTHPHTVPVVLTACAPPVNDATW